MAEVARLVIGVVVRRQFVGVELEAGIVGIGLVLDVVEDEEFGFRSDEYGIADAGCLQIGFSLLGGAARVAVIGLARNRVENVAQNDHGGLREERVHMDRFRIRHEHHVGLVDGLPSADRRTVEHDAIGKHVLVDASDVHCHVLQLTLGIREAQVNEFYVIVLDLLKNFACGRH
jgi:hypothetical protein